MDQLKTLSWKSTLKVSENSGAPKQEDTRYQGWARTLRPCARRGRLLPRSCAASGCPCSGQQRHWRRLWWELLARIHRLFLTYRPFPCGVNQRSMPSSKVSLFPPAANPTGLQQERGGPNRRWPSTAARTSKAEKITRKPSSKQSNHAMVYLGCIQTCPIMLQGLGQLHTMEILLDFSPQISLTQKRLQLK